MKITIEQFRGHLDAMSTRALATGNRNMLEFTVEVNEALTLAEGCFAVPEEDAEAKKLQVDLFADLRFAEQIMKKLRGRENTFAEMELQLEYFDMLALLMNAVNRAESLQDLLLASRQGQLPLFGPQPRPQPSRSGSTATERSVAYTFSENLKRVLREEGKSEQWFIGNGPLGNAKRAREFIQGTSVPPRLVMKQIARKLKVDPDRLLMNISPENLKQLMP